jgi:hypothetical protein
VNDILPGLEEKLALRLEIEERARWDRRFQEECRERIADPKEGDCFFIDNFCWTFDPRIDPDTNLPVGPVPFLLWPRQEELVQFLAGCIDDAHPGAVKKSRDVGASWCVLAVIFKRWLTVRSFQALLGSYMDDYVDKAGNPDCLFWKLDFLLKWLPAWLYPKGYSEKEHRAFSTMRNPQVGSAITGQAPTQRWGRGGRKTVALLDEWAFWQYGREGAQAVAGSAPCRLYISTPNGQDPNNHFDHLLHSKGDYADSEVDQFMIHWTHDPRKNVVAIDPTDGKEYYPFKRMMIGDKDKGIRGQIPVQQFAEEYDIDFEGSLRGTIYSEQCPLARLGVFPYNPKFPLYCAMDFGISDTFVAVWVQFDYELFRYRVIDTYAASGRGIDFYIPLLLGQKEGEVLEYDYAYGPEERRHIHTRNAWKRAYRDSDGKMVYSVPYRDVFGDPSGRQRSQVDGRSVKSALFDAGILLKDNTKTAGTGFKGRIQDSRMLLTSCDFDLERCRQFFEHLRAYKINPITGKPLHDDSSHRAAAFQYFAVNNPHKDEVKERGTALPIAAGGFQGGVFGNPHLLERGMKGEELFAYSYTTLPLDEDEMEERSRNTRARKGRTGYGF